jgi:F0F1-type ATP synthase epsilon subunit
LLKVKIITPKEVAYDGTALTVTISTETGEMQVYQGSDIENAVAAPVCFEVDEGFFRVTQDKVSLLVDTLQPVPTVKV